MIFFTRGHVEACSKTSPPAQARQVLEKSLGAAVRTCHVEAVPEGADAERVMREMAAGGVRPILATNFGYLDSGAQLEGRDGPFHGRLVDQSGTVRQTAGVLGDEALAQMDWFVQGVVGSLPTK